MIPGARVLVVDDEPNVCASLSAVLEDEDCIVDTADDGEKCLKQLERKTYDVILLDVWLPGRDGIEVLEEIRRGRPGQYVIMISGHGNIETAIRAIKKGAFDFIEKPLELDKVMLVLEHALRQKRLEEENATLRDLMRQDTVMIGDSVPMQALRQQIDYAAPTEGRVLIYGENGTGKELVARMLHLQSRRSKQRFVEVNCAAIPDDLIEAELFGSVKGAFTGSTESRKGKFALADQGTIFLDEVGDMSLKTQAKVLRVLEEQRFHPVGATEPLEVDVRVIAATNKNLEAEIENGNFREDLFFRLNVIPFEVPPLRERRQDIPVLVDYFTDHFSRRYGRKAKTFSKQALRKLKQYHWPGNVRELKNMVERIVIMKPGTGTKVEVKDLPHSILGTPHVRTSATTWAEAKNEFERSFLLRSLLEHEGNVSRTARAIGLERSHLHRKLKAHGIKR